MSDFSGWLFGMCGEIHFQFRRSTLHCYIGQKMEDGLRKPSRFVSDLRRRKSSDDGIVLLLHPDTPHDRRFRRFAAAAGWLSEYGCGHEKLTPRGTLCITAGEEPAGRRPSRRRRRHPRHFFTHCAVEMTHATRPFHPDRRKNNIQIGEPR